MDSFVLPSIYPGFSRQDYRCVRKRCISIPVWTIFLWFFPFSSLFRSFSHLYSHWTKRLRRILRWCDIYHLVEAFLLRERSHSREISRYRRNRRDFTRERYLGIGGTDWLKVWQKFVFLKTPSYGCHWMQNIKSFCLIPYNVCFDIFLTVWLFFCISLLPAKLAIF